nr:transposase family protein [Micromonospora sp. U56]
MERWPPPTLAEPDAPGLLQVLAQVPDPRDRRGRIHPLPGLLAVAVAAVASGQSRVVEITEWAADLPDAVWDRLGAARDRFTGARRVPDDSTLGRVLAGIDADALDAAMCRWLISRAGSGGSGRWVIAVDGKKMARPCMAAVRLAPRSICSPPWITATGSFSPRATSMGKRTRSPGSRPCWTPSTWPGRSSRRTHCIPRREHARWLIEDKKAGYVFVVKRNQPRLYRQVKTLPWAKIPVLDATHDRGHGRHDIRRLQAITCLGPLALDFPHASQALRIRRRRYNPANGRWSTVTIYAITNLTADQAEPAELADWLRGHLVHRGTTPHPRHHLP